MVTLSEQGMSSQRGSWMSEETQRWASGGKDKTTGSLLRGEAGQHRTCVMTQVGKDRVGARRTSSPRERRWGGRGGRHTGSRSPSGCHMPSLTCTAG